MGIIPSVSFFFGLSTIGNGDNDADSDEDGSWIPFEIPVQDILSVVLTPTNRFVYIIEQIILSKQLIFFSSDGDEFVIKIIFKVYMKIDDLCCKSVQFSFPNRYKNVLMHNKKAMEIFHVI